MSEVAKPIALYALTGVMSWIASRYHLSGDQAAAMSADIVAVASGVAGVVLHWIAYKSPPPGVSK